MSEASSSGGKVRKRHNWFVEIEQKMGFPPMDFATVVNLSTDFQLPRSSETHLIQFNLHSSYTWGLVMHSGEVIPTTTLPHSLSEPTSVSRVIAVPFTGNEQQMIIGVLKSLRVSENMQPTIVQKARDLISGLPTTGLSTPTFISVDIRHEKILFRFGCRMDKALFPDGTAKIAEKKLWVFEYNIGGKVTDKCLICHEEWDFENVDRVFLLPCKHLFHQDCLIQWESIGPHCPTCRSTLMRPRDPGFMKGWKEDGELHTRLLIPKYIE